MSASFAGADQMLCGSSQWYVQTHDVAGRQRVVQLEETRLSGLKREVHHADPEGARARRGLAADVPQPNRLSI
jgi:hypothetical protein